MQIGSTILAFPNHKLNQSIRYLNSVEWTAKMLDEKEAGTKIANAMLSIIDLSKDEFQGDRSVSLKNADIQHEITRNIELGLLKGIEKYVYGSPKTREDITSVDEIKQYLLKIEREVNKIQTKQNVTFYIEPLPHKNNVLDTFESVVKACKELNQAHKESKVIFKPLYDLGTRLKQNNKMPTKEEAMYIAKHTDRVHVSQENVQNEINELAPEYRNFLKLINHYNSNITFIYEHINLNENNSLEEFITKMNEPPEACSEVQYDVAIIGGGIYGLYSAYQLIKKGLLVLIISKDDVRHGPLKDKQIASVINQARVHNGYHYPRSITTAKQSIQNYERFKNDFKDCVIDDFNQIYAIPRYGTQTSSSQFETFCHHLDIRCDEFISKDLIKDNIQKSWLTDEAAVDTCSMMNKMVQLNQKTPMYFDSIEHLNYNRGQGWNIQTSDGSNFKANRILNMSYAGINEIEHKVKGAQIKKTSIQYQVCEVALFKTKNDMHLNNGYTFMDGPFVSIMPHTKEGLISLTSVTHTPHIKSNLRPNFKNITSRKDFMLQEAKQFLAKKYLDELQYVESRYVIKAVPQDASHNDNRLITINENTYSNFTSILSGKLNAIYELDDYLNKIVDEH